MCIGLTKTEKVSNFMKVRSAVLELLHTDSQDDGSGSTSERVRNCPERLWSSLSPFHARTRQFGPRIARRTYRKLSRRFSLHAGRTFYSMSLCAFLSASSLVLTGERSPNKHHSETLSLVYPLALSLQVLKFSRFKQHWCWNYVFQVSY
jgi:hypothetical protein